MTIDDEQAASPDSRKKWFRLGLIAFLVVGLLLVAWQTGLTDLLTKEYLRGVLADSGWSGFGWFTLACCVGLFIHVPGIVFVSAAALVFGPWKGALVAFAAETIAVCVTFFIIRGVGGQPLGELKNRWLRKAMEHLDQRPLLTVIGLRTFFQASPPVNYALALSPLPVRHYVVGSAVGLIAPCIVISLFVHGVFG
jgi:uncharacterized membrane protein YdjX (TVP38/TMEM64 family)